MLRSVLLGILTFLAVAYATFHIVLWLRPTLVHGHKRMALGHAMIAIAVGGAAGIAILVADYRGQRRRHRQLP